MTLGWVFVMIKGAVPWAGIFFLFRERSVNFLAFLSMSGLILVIHRISVLSVNQLIIIIFTFDNV